MRLLASAAALGLIVVPFSSASAAEKPGSAYLQCDGQPDNVTDGETAARLLGAVTLLGDAAHPVLPHTGQGAAQAIVDAVALGRALAREAAVPRALRAYEAERRRKTATLLAQGRRTAAIMRTTNPIACYLRELAVRAMPVKTLFRAVATINRRAGTDVAGRSEV